MSAAAEAAAATAAAATFEEPSDPEACTKTWAKEIAVAVNAVVRASRVTEFVRKSAAGYELAIKDDHSPVTVGDLAAQAVINAELRKAFPEYGIVGEESAEQMRGSSENATRLREQVVKAVQELDKSATENSIMESIDGGNSPGGPKGRFWTLDPIDGTKGFLRNDQYTIALGLIEDGKVVLGVLGCPVLPVNMKDPSPNKEKGCIFYAASDSKTSFVMQIDQKRGTPIQVSNIAKASSAVVLESVEAGHTAHDISSVIMRSLNITQQSLRMDSQAKYGCLARGDGAIYLRLPRPGKPYQEKIWDHAAGTIVIEKAGGKVTDIHGKSLNFAVGTTLKENEGVIATSGAIHDEVIASVKAAFAAAASEPKKSH